ncbi:unnamed protein product, partial [marine sediment metagenome]
MSGSEAKISLRVYPGAARSEVVGFTEGVLQVKVAAPPVKGQANKELLAFLSKTLAVGKGALTIVKGHTSTGEYPTHAYKTAGSYTVSLKVTDDRGN